MFKLNDMSSRRVAWPQVTAVLALVAIGVATAARSDASLVGADVVNVKARIDEGRKAPPPVREKFRLRCWQHGRLLFEESIAEVPPAFAGQSMAIPSGETANGTVYMLNTPNGICLLKPTDSLGRGSAMLPTS